MPMCKSKPYAIIIILSSVPKYIHLFGYFQIFKYFWADPENTKTLKYQKINKCQIWYLKHQIFSQTAKSLKYQNSWECGRVFHHVLEL